LGRDPRTFQETLDGGGGESQKEEKKGEKKPNGKSPRKHQKSRKRKNVKGRKKMVRHMVAAERFSSFLEGRRRRRNFGRKKDEARRGGGGVTSRCGKSRQSKPAKGGLRDAQALREKGSKNHGLKDQGKKPPSNHDGSYPSPASGNNLKRKERWVDENQRVKRRSRGRGTTDPWKGRFP